MEWPSGEATVCKTVHTGSIPVSTSDKRFLHRVGTSSSSLSPSELGLKRINVGLGSEMCVFVGGVIVLRGIGGVHWGGGS